MSEADNSHVPDWATLVTRVCPTQPDRDEVAAKGRTSKIAVGVSRGLQPRQGAGTPPKDSIGMAAVRTKAGNEIDLGARAPIGADTRRGPHPQPESEPKIDLSRPGT